jgi:hypothetical protein
MKRLMVLSLGLMFVSNLSANDTKALSWWALFKAAFIKGQISLSACYKKKLQDRIEKKQNIQKHFGPKMHQMCVDFPYYAKKRLEQGAPLSGAETQEKIDHMIELCKKFGCSNC